MKREDTTNRRVIGNASHRVPPELLDVAAVAALLGGCSTRHVRRLSDSGRMPRPMKLGALIRWRRAEVLAWIAGGCRQVASTSGATQ